MNTVHLLGSIFAVLCTTSVVLYSDDAIQTLRSECSNTLSAAEWNLVNKFTVACHTNDLPTLSRIITQLQKNYNKAADIVAATLALAVYCSCYALADALLKNIQMQFYLINGLTRNNKNVTNFLVWVIKRPYQRSCQAIKNLLFIDILWEGVGRYRFNGTLNADKAINMFLRACVCDVMFMVNECSEKGDVESSRILVSFIFSHKFLIYEFVEQTRKRASSMNNQEAAEYHPIVGVDYTAVPPERTFYGLAKDDDLSCGVQNSYDCVDKTNDSSLLIFKNNQGMDDVVCGCVDKHVHANGTTDPYVPTIELKEREPLVSESQNNQPDAVGTDDFDFSDIYGNDGDDNWIWLMANGQSDVNDFYPENAL